jgi:hypothetical protein
MRIVIIASFLLFCTKVLPQGQILPEWNPSYHTVDRLDIMGFDPIFFTSIKNYQREDVLDLALRSYEMHHIFSKPDLDRLLYIFRDNDEWLVDTLEGKRQEYYTPSKKPMLKRFYKSPATFIQVDEPAFQMRLNPIINFKLGKQSDDSDLTFYNQRGLEIRGRIDKKIYFYTNIIETQARFTDYVTERVKEDNAIPGAGFFKNYNSKVFDFEDGYDFLNGVGYVGFNASKHIGFQLGHGTHFIGNGFRSLLLSDFANNYFYLQINTRVWKFHYQNIFAELAINSAKDTPGSERVGKKYMAAHYLGVRLFNRLDLGLYEAVVYDRDNQFELQYLNPIILYRTIEGFIGSPDNVLLGLDLKYNFLDRFQAYGQLMFDEFKFDELFIENRGWWANKYGVQLGLKYIDAFGVDQLDLQVEYNLVKPFTYSHTDSTSNYSHFKQELAHPLGSNFKEQIFIVNYSPSQKWHLSMKLFNMQAAEDSIGVNLGNDILLPNTTRSRDYNHEIGQGIGTDIFLAKLGFSYQWKHNLFFEIDYGFRKYNSEEDTNDDSTHFFSTGIRFNIGNREMAF